MEANFWDMAEGRLVVSGTRPAISVDPNKSCWCRGPSITAPQHLGEPVACVNTQGDPKSSTFVWSQMLSPHLLHLAWVMLHSLQDNPSCNEDCQNRNATTGWKHPSILLAKFFSSLLCFSVTFHHALFPTISLVWQHDILVCQLLGVKVYWHFGKQATPDKHDFPAEIITLHPVPFMAVIWLWEQTLHQTLEIKSFHSLALELLSHLSISFFSCSKLLLLAS